MIAITGANGQLGRLVLKRLLETVPADQLVAAVREPAKAEDLRALGVQVRAADYDQPETLAAAFAGVDKVLLISAVVPGQRLRQHQAVVDAAKQAGVGLLAYTSLLRADSSPLQLAVEHLATETYIKATDLPYVILRNGWYLENTTGVLTGALAHGAIIGSSGEGRFASATRADYADAAAAVLTAPGHAGQTYELAGDASFSMSEVAAELSLQSGRSIGYSNLPPAEYAAILLQLGLPQIIVDVVVDADVQAQHGALDSSSRDLSRLLARPTTGLAAAITAVLPG